MSKRLRHILNADLWLWEELERELAPERFQRLRKEYLAIWRADVRELTQARYEGERVEEVQALLEQLINEAWPPDATEILETLLDFDDQRVQQHVANNEENADEDLGHRMYKTTLCGICERVGNRDEDWLCRQCRNKLEGLITLLQQQGIRRTLLLDARKIIGQADAFIGLVDYIDEGWAEDLRFKQYHANRDHTRLMKLKSQSGRPRDPLYDKVDRLMQESGLTRNEAIAKIRAEDPEAAKRPPELFVDALRKTKRSP